MGVFKKIINRYRVFLEIILIFIVPVLLLNLNIIPRRFYLLVLFFCIICVVVLVINERWSLKILNIRTDNLKNTFVPYFIFTILGCGFLVLMAAILHKEKIITNPWMLLLGWSIPIGLVQEFLYRGFLIPKIKKIYSSLVVVVLLNGAIFSFLHILYKPLSIVLPITFVAGIFFAWLYIKFPNLLILSLSHGILNFVAIWYGFF